MRQTREPSTPWREGLFPELLRGQTRVGLKLRLDNYVRSLGSVDAMGHAATVVRWELWKLKRILEIEGDTTDAKRRATRYGSVIVEAQRRAGFQVLDA